MKARKAEPFKNWSCKNWSWRCPGCTFLNFNLIYEGANGSGTEMASVRQTCKFCGIPADRTDRVDNSVELPPADPERRATLRDAPWTDAS